ncbi:MAG: hypothetical protein SNJ53_06840, partial [Thermodesulfovibrionales bacterium]
NNPNPILIISNANSLNGVLCTQNPYSPIFRDSVVPLLPLRCGAFKIGDNIFYWSKFINHENLLTELKQNFNIKKIVRLAYLLLKMQKTEYLSKKSILSELLELVSSKTSDTNLANFFDSEITFICNICFDDNDIPSSWSHGDLWPKDIYSIEEDRFIIIDWEWALNKAPISVDLIDLYLTTVEHVFNKTDLYDCFIAFFYNTIKEMALLRNIVFHYWQKNNLTKKDICFILLYVMIRWWARELVQQGEEAKIYTTRNKKIFLATLSFIDNFSNNDLKVLYNDDINLKLHVMELLKQGDMARAATIVYEKLSSHENLSTAIYLSSLLYLYNNDMERAKDLMTQLNINYTNSDDDFLLLKNYLQEVADL